MLVSEIEMKQGKIDECQKYSEQYSAAVKVINNVILKILFFVCKYHGMPVVLCIFSFYRTMSCRL